MREMFRAKIHRAKVTDANLNYEGNITIDSTLLKASGIIEYEKVAVWNVTNGERIETYVLEGKADSGVICLNGSAARRFEIDDIVIIATFGIFNEDELKNFKPKVILVDNENKIKK